MTYQWKSLIRNSQGKGFMPLSGEKKTHGKGHQHHVTEIRKRFVIQLRSPAFLIDAKGIQI